MLLEMDGVMAGRDGQMRAGQKGVSRHARTTTSLDFHCAAPSVLFSAAAGIRRSCAVRGISFAFAGSPKDRRNDCASQARGSAEQRRRASQPGGKDYADIAAAGFC